MLQKISVLLLVGVLLASCASFTNQGSAAGYEMISVGDLQGLMEAEDVTLVNVHIPLEGNIPGTDLMIPFDEVEGYLDLLPENKDEKIILYCRSGSMGDTASETLVDLGYTDVSNLEGGYNAWKANGLPFKE
jgi:rhodanese-related sulfurtransferase